ncbi:MAG: CapA family protein [Deltaproteobacteria bacterium]|jgi:poly-gamma-glutamate capsule biosynthesis protein CapA/YwtB (metallophosphatase superfamily)|nr:CapA family protein [Deltaproteobacteria bacterium]
MINTKFFPFFQAVLGALLFLGLLNSGCLAQAPVQGQSQPVVSVDNQTPAQPSRVFKVAAVGDIMMGTENLLPPDGGAGFFKDVAPYLKDRDLVIGNLEGPLTDRGAPTKTIVAGRSYCFRTPPSYGQHLKTAGFTAMSLANNHANDYGPEGRAQTVEVLESLGIQHAGAPGQVTVFKAGDREVAFLALAPNRNCQNINDIQGAVNLVKVALRENPERLVVVSFHGGAEGTAHMAVPHGPEVYLGENRGDLINLSHSLIEAGAAAVIGHGPHVPRAVEVYKGHLIAYSLGNFATASGINVKGATGLAPLLLFDLDEAGQLVDYEIVSFRQQMNKGPKLDPSREAAKVIGDLSERLAKELAAK